MSADALATQGATAVCARLGHCPLCGAANECRLETGEAYKGPCWCERPTVSAAALRRLLADLAEPRCLCRGCLQRIEANPDIPREAFVRHGLLETALAASPLEPTDGDYYWEGVSMVFTAQYHLRRGSCCGSGCRHCPYGN